MAQYYIQISYTDLRSPYESITFDLISILYSLLDIQFVPLFFVQSIAVDAQMIKCLCHDHDQHPMYSTVLQAGQIMPSARSSSLSSTTLEHTPYYVLVK